MDGCPFSHNVLAFFLIISMRFHSIQKCYNRIIVRVPINLREFFPDIYIKHKEGEERGKLMNFKKIENFQLKVS